MLPKILFATCFILSLTGLSAQKSIDSLLLKISKNNKTIIANKQFSVAKKLQSKVGLTLKNPSVEFIYLFGVPKLTGNQLDFLVTQSFDFPTAYAIKKQLAATQSTYNLAAKKKDILLEAKLIIIELIYLNKKEIQLKNRLQRSEHLVQNYQTKLDKGEANIFDINKAKLQLLNLQLALKKNQRAISHFNQELTQLNGGVDLQIMEVNYPTPTIPNLEELIKLVELSDHSLKSLVQQTKINSKEIELSKAMALPKFKAGYRSQAILGSQFHGFQVGFTIPIWEKKQQEEFKKAELIFSQLRIEEHENNHNAHLHQLFDQYLSLKATLQEYQQLLTSLDNTKLLEKALKLGEISTIQYFMEINLLNDSFDQYLHLEKEYHLVVAMLNKYEL